MKNFSKTTIISLGLVIAVLAVFGAYFYRDGFFAGKGAPELKFQKDAKDNIVKFGYFFGGRIHVVYRAYINNYFDNENIGVRLYTQWLREDDWYEVPQNHEEMHEITQTVTPEGGDVSGIVREFGKVTGIKIIEAMDQGLFAGGTPGESSFIYQVTKGSPIVAVALLGHDDKDRPGKSIVVRQGLTINSPEDFKGKTFISRRAGPGDAIWLKEFIKSIGLDPKKDVTIMDQTPDDLQTEYLRTGKADAALLHMHGVPQIEAAGIAYMYRGMDWMNPELSHALLVFRKDFVEQYPKKVQAIVDAYVKRVAYEDTLSEEEKHKPGDFGIQIAHHYKGLSLPIFDLPPLVRVDLLEEMQRLMLEYGDIDELVDLNDFIDNSFVKNSMINYEELQ